MYLDLGLSDAFIRKNSHSFFISVGSTWFRVRYKVGIYVQDKHCQQCNQY